MEPQTVYTLLCHRDMNMALVTMPRLLRFLTSDQKLLIFDDGSLTDDDIRALNFISVNISVITRSIREEFIQNKLINYPICRQYRERSPLSFKLIDIPLYAQNTNARFTYTDSDIIYTKNCESYFKQNRNVYLKSDTIALSVGLKKVLFKYRWPIPTNFNSGYFSYDSGNFDLDFIEYFISLSDVYDFPWLTEQTCWALLFERSGLSYCTSEEQFICKEHFDQPTSETLAIHLIVNLKNKYTEWAVDDYSPAQQPIFRISKNVTLWHLISRSINRLISQW